MIAFICDMIGYAIELYLLYHLIRFLIFLFNFICYYLPKHEDFRFTSGHMKLPPLKSSERFEYKVYRKLRPIFGKDARFITNAVIPTRSGSFTEVDLLVISRYGLTIIEAKNYKCDIVADFTRREWEYPFGSGKQIVSPLVQNEYHAKRLNEYIHDHPSVFPERYRDCPYDAMLALLVFPDKTPIRFTGMQPPADCLYAVGGLGSVKSNTRRDFKRDGELFTSKEVDEMFYQMRAFYRYTKKERRQMIVDRSNGRLAALGEY